MMNHNRMQQKYFFRQLLHHLLIITLPILLLGILIIHYFQLKLQNELTVYAERSKNDVLNSVTEVLNTFSEQTALFSTSPSMALSISRLMNEQSLDYKNNVMKSIIPTIIGTTANMSDYVDSTYIYYDNPYGNFFHSSTGYTNISSSGCTDSEWLSIYEDTDTSMKKWVVPRSIKNYSFEQSTDVLSIFRRFDYLEGVMVLNLNVENLCKMLDVNQIYQNSCTLVARQDGSILFGSSNFKDLMSGKDNISDIITQPVSVDSIYHTIQIENTSYIYYSSSIPDYDVTMISLLPTSEVFNTVHSMVLSFAAIIIFSILLSISLSFSGTVTNFRQLRQLLDLFAQAESGEELPPLPRSNARNEYDLIFNNIISTFVSNNILKLHLAKAEMNQKDARLAALQLQLNPHFIFNTLQTIDLEVLKLQPVDNLSSSLIHHLSDILKYSLENTTRQVQIRDEIHVCKLYAEIQKRRYTTPFILYWEYEDEVLSCPIIHLVFQPLLENSLHHAIKELSRQGVIKIKIQKRNQRIHFYFIDNGLGIPKTKLQEIRRQLRQHDMTHTSHIGLYNTNLRLILTYGEESEIDIKSKEGQGTIVHFSIPLL